MFLPSLVKVSSGPQTAPYLVDSPTYPLALSSVRRSSSYVGHYARSRGLEAKVYSGLIVGEITESKSANFQILQRCPEKRPPLVYHNQAVTTSKPS